jgi:hypothetical protein
MRMSLHKKDLFSILILGVISYMSMELHRPSVVIALARGFSSVLLLTKTGILGTGHVMYAFVNMGNKLPD